MKFIKVLPLGVVVFHLIIQSITGLMIDISFRHNIIGSTYGHHHYKEEILAF